MARQMVGMGHYSPGDDQLVLTADIAACLSLEALHGTDRAYDARVHALRPYPRRINCADFLRLVWPGAVSCAAMTPTTCKTLYLALRAPGSRRGARFDCLRSMGDRHRD